MALSLVTSKEMSSRSSSSSSTSSSRRLSASRSGSISDSSSVESFCDEISQRLDRVKAAPEHTLQRQAICGCARSDPLPRRKRSPRNIFQEHRIFLAKSKNHVDSLIASTCCELCGLVLPPRQGVRPPWQPFPSIGIQSAYEIHAYSVQAARPDYTQTECAAFEAAEAEIATVSFDDWKGFVKTSSGPIFIPRPRSEPQSPTCASTFESQHHDYMSGGVFGTSWLHSLSSQSSIGSSPPARPDSIKPFSGLYDAKTTADLTRGIVLLDEELCQSPETITIPHIITQVKTRKAKQADLSITDQQTRPITSPEPAALFRTRTWSLCQSPDLSPIAEGVEDAAERKRLRLKLRREMKLAANQKAMPTVQLSVVDCCLGEVQVARVEKLTVYKGAALEHLSIRVREVSSEET